MAVLAVAVAATGAVIAAAPRCGSEPAARLSCEPVPERDGWKELVLGTTEAHAVPRSVEVEGDPAAVADPDGVLVAGDGRQATLTTTAAGSARLVLDFGVPVSGHVEITVERAAGASIRASYAEARQFLGPDGDADPDPAGFTFAGRSMGTDDDPDARADVFPPPAAPTTLVTVGLRGSQRWLALTLDGPGTLVVDAVRVRRTNFAPGHHTAHFLSSDPLLNKIWYASAYTMDLATARDQRSNPGASWVVMDGAKRDRLPYGANVREAVLSARYLGEPYRRVVRDSLNLFACQQDPDGSLPAATRIDVPCDPADPGPPDGTPAGFAPPAEAGMARVDSYAAWWVIGVADYLRSTGDVEFATAMLPVARRVVQFFADHATGGPLWRTEAFGGRPYAVNWHPPDMADGIDAYSNEAYFGALQALASLERAIGAGADAAAALDARAGEVRSALMTRLWDPQAGAMLLREGDPRPDHTSDANAGALVFGLLDADQARRVMAFLRDRLGSPYGRLNSERADNPFMTQFVSPYVMLQEAVGRFRYGDGRGALDLIRTGWGHMLAVGPGTTWEEVGVDGAPRVPRPGTSLAWGGHTSLVHPWTSVLPVLSGELVGVRPVEDGFRRWEVAPQPSGLTWAQGRVEVPGGTIAARWTRDERSFVLTVDAATDAPGRVVVPLLGGDRTVALDGRVVWPGAAAPGGVEVRREGDTLVIDGLRGTHTAAWQD
ncbi:alpha-L-rhamnosidase C-terminal domain-containing protein [Pseudonocardia sp. CA-107938]|uniref:alpha-L-rhamnosidase C-terminal domain-containing protein n=1 Tax=Pseudonocardia sp. CA-107938 TaxID=3240021 RepID=UPI003D939A04